MKLTALKHDTEELYKKLCKVKYNLWTEYSISLLSVLLFINMIGLYYITKNLRLEVKISYNKGRDEE